MKNKIIPCIALTIAFLYTDGRDDSYNYLKIDTLKKIENLNNVKLSPQDKREIIEMQQTIEKKIVDLNK